MVRTKNDYPEFREPTESQYRHVIANVLFKYQEVEQVVEVQITTLHFAVSRKWSHRPYKVVRASEADELRAQKAWIFREPSDTEGVAQSAAHPSTWQDVAATSSRLGGSKDVDKDVFGDFRLAV